MNTKRKQPEVVSRALPPAEAFEYEDDVTEGAVKTLQEQADKILEQGDWHVIEGDKERK